MNLALAVGLLLGYLLWGRDVLRLERQLAEARLRGQVASVEQTWTVEGVVRAVIPEINVVILTHEEIPGYMPASMTMGFRTQDPKLLEGLEVGDAIRFTLRGVPPNVLIIALTRQGKL